MTSGICGAFSYDIKELDDYDWLSLDSSTSTIILTPDQDAVPDTYSLTLQVMNLEIPFQGTIEPGEVIEEEEEDEIVEPVEDPEI